MLLKLNLSVSQLPIGLSNDWWKFELLNIIFMSVTEEVFHLLISWLNAKMQGNSIVKHMNIVVTLETFLERG